MQVASADLVSTAGAGLVLSVQAVAPTLGWTNVDLSPLIYLVPPPDGIQGYVLTGTPPTGPTADVLEVFELSSAISPPAWLQGVRVTPAGRTTGLTVHRARQGAQPIGSDSFLGGPLGISGDKLIVPVAYSGGCGAHSFQLSWDGKINKSIPPQVVLELSHDAHGDQCRALIKETLQFDLSVLAGFPAEETLLVVRGQGFEGTILYSPPSLGSGQSPRCPDCYLQLVDWHAFHDAMPGGPHNLYVIGKVLVRTLGYRVSLAPAAPQGINPRILLLDLTVQQPGGVAATQLDYVSVRWDRTPYNGGYLEVHIRCGSQIVQKLPIEVVS